MAEDGVGDLMLKNRALMQAWDDQVLKFNKSERVRQSRKFQKEVQLAIIGAHESFGEEEIYSGQKQRQHSAICFS